MVIYLILISFYYFTRIFFSFSHLKSQAQIILGFILVSHLKDRCRRNRHCLLRPQQRRPQSRTDASTGLLSVRLPSDDRHILPQNLPDSIPSSPACHRPTPIVRACLPREYFPNGFRRPWYF